MCSSLLLFFFKQKTAYEMRISDWSSDVCSSDLTPPPPATNETPDYGTDYGAPTPDPSLDGDLATGNEQVTGVPQDSAAGTTPTDPGTAATSGDPSTTYKEDDLIGAAEGVFRSGEHTYELQSIMRSS